MKRYLALRIESYEGEDTFLRCGSDSQDFLYAIVTVEDDGQIAIVDSGYRSLDEAIETWPEVRQNILEKQS